MIKSFDALIEKTKRLKNKSKVAVIAAHDQHTLESITAAQKDGLIEAVLIGNQEEIKSILSELHANPANFEIICTSDNGESVKTAVDYVRSNKAHALMKGKLETAEIIRAILSKENELALGGLISSVGFFEIPAYHKLIAITDMAINLYPNLEQKINILKNAVGVMNTLEMEKPKVAVLSAIEKVNPKMPDTIDGYELKRLNQSGEISDCIVEGPISFDLATSKEAASVKNYDSSVAGDADLLVVPDIVSGNILAKSITGFAKGKTAGLVVGAKVPIILTSRAAEASDKYYSIALAAYSAKKGD